MPTTIADLVETLQRDLTDDPKAIAHLQCFYLPGEDVMLIRIATPGTKYFEPDEGGSLPEPTPIPDRGTT